MQAVVVYILIGLAVLVVGLRIYKIITNKHKCCGEGDEGCHCEGCELAKECSMKGKEKCKKLQTLNSKP